MWAESTGDGQIFGRVSNGNQIASSVIPQACYRKLLMEKSLNQDSRIRVLPLYTGVS